MTEDTGHSGDVVEALGRAAFTVTAVLTTVGAAHDLSLTQVRVLGILRDRQLRMADLAAYLGLERSTLSGLVDRAERRGLVARQRGDLDRRAIEVTLTDAGQDLAARAYAEVARAVAPGIDRLTAADQAQLAALLGTFLGPDPDVT